MLNYVQRIQSGRAIFIFIWFIFLTQTPFFQNRNAILLFSSCFCSFPGRQTLFKISRPMQKRLISYVWTIVGA